MIPEILPRCGEGGADGAKHQRRCPCLLEDGPLVVIPGRPERHRGYLRIIKNHPGQDAT
ncbi:hypothetical protein ATKI12_1334 [Kitasatospora sp. Ki12]